MMSLPNPKIRTVVQILQIYKHHLNHNHVRHLNHMILPMIKKATPRSNSSTHNVCLTGSAWSHSSFYRQGSLYDLINYSGHKRFRHKKKGKLEINPDKSVSNFKTTQPMDGSGIKDVSKVKLTEEEFIASVDEILRNPKGVPKRDLIRAQTYRANEIAEDWFRALDNKSPTDSEWVEFKTSIQSLTRVSWDIFCMKILSSQDNLKHAQVLMSYLEKSTSTSLNRVVLSIYVDLLGYNSDGNVEIEDKTKKYFEKVISENSIIDPPTAEHLMRGITNTRHYLESKTILDIALDLYPTEVTSLESHLLEACIKNNNMKLVDSLMNNQDMLINTISLWNSRYINCLDSCLKSGNEQGMVMLTDLFRENMIYFTEPEIEKICEAFERRQPGKWTLTKTFIHKKEKYCNNCSMVMEDFVVSDTDFSAIQDKFMQQVIVNDNIYYRSSPKELNKFTSFVKKTSPYDVVIDGLNNLVLHGLFGLSKIIKHYTNQGLKVLVVGHFCAVFNKFVKLQENLTQNNPAKNVGQYFIYLCQTTKADDVFMLYAALRSSKHCKIVTHDKLRQHKELLEPELRKGFQRWLATVHVCDHSTDKHHNFFPGFMYDAHLGPSRDPGGWHFPVEDRGEDQPWGLNTVLCARQKSSTFQHPSPSSVQDSSIPEKHSQEYKQKDKAENRTSPSLERLDTLFDKSQSLVQKSSKPNKASKLKQSLKFLDTMFDKSPSLVQESSKPHKASKVKQSQKDEAENQTPHFLDTMFDKSPSLVQESSKPHRASKIKQSQKDEAENQTPHFLDTMFDKLPFSVQESSIPENASQKYKQIEKVQKPSQKDDAENQTPYFLDTLLDKSKHSHKHSQKHSHKHSHKHLHKHLQKYKLKDKAENQTPHLIDTIFDKTEHSQKQLKRKVYDNKKNKNS